MRAWWLTLAAVPRARAMAPPRRIAAERTMRVLIADVRDEVQWLPGDRHTLRRPTPAQAAALRAASMEAMVTSTPALVAMLPTVAAPVAPAAPPGGGGAAGESAAPGARRDAEASFRRAFMEARQTSSGLRVAALCAVRGVRTVGTRGGGRGAAGGVGLAIESATLEVVGRVALRQLEVLAEADVPLWDDDARAGGTSLVAAVGGNAVLQDAWVDEIKQSPVHAVHRLRPLADDCARHHDAVRAALRGTPREVDVALDRPLRAGRDAKGRDVSSVRRGSRSRDAVRGVR